jgi:hypothetical protein
MKIQFRCFLPAVLLAAPLAAAPLMETTAIHAQADTSAPAIGYLKAGTEPVAVANVTAPPGWVAVAISGPHEAYVRNSDLTKGLDVHPGAALRQLPKADAPVLTTMQEGDQVEITGLRPGWTQIKLSRDVVGYIKIGGDASPPPPAVSSGAVLPPALPAGSAAPVLSSGPASALPHTFQGMLVATKRFLLIGPRPEYDYQLEGVEGKRIAYLDVTKVLATLKMEKFVDSPVIVSGVLEQTYNGKNLVIEVETLDLQ